MIDETFQLLWPEGMVSDRDAVVAMRRCSNMTPDRVGGVTPVVCGAAVGRGAKGTVGESSLSRHQNYGNRTERFD